jgi:hypothetical protein
LLTPNHSFLYKKVMILLLRNDNKDGITMTATAKQIYNSNQTITDYYYHRPNFITKSKRSGDCIKRVAYTTFKMKRCNNNTFVRMRMIKIVMLFIVFQLLCPNTTLLLLYTTPTTYMITVAAFHTATTTTTTTTTTIQRRIQSQHYKYHCANNYYSTNTNYRIQQQLLLSLLLSLQPYHSFYPKLILHGSTTQKLTTVILYNSVIETTTTDPTTNRYSVQQRQRPFSSVTSDANGELYNNNRVPSVRTTTTTTTNIHTNKKGTVKNNNTTNYQRQSIGDHIYKRVQWFGKVLTFQSSKPRNSIYFFGPNRNSMQHYNVQNNITPSQRIFRLVDDIGNINDNSNSNMRMDMGDTNQRRSLSFENIGTTKQSSTTTSATASTTDTTVTSPIQSFFQSLLIPEKIYPLWNRRRQEQEEDRLDEETNFVFDQDNFQQQVLEEEKQVWEALVSLEKDMSKLDRMIGTKPQLSYFQLILLGSAVLSTATSPLFFAGQLTEFVAPSMAAFTAAIGIAAEYRGRVAVADSKEVAAASLQCAAEAEGYLASAERAKAVR